MRPDGVWLGGMAIAKRVSRCGDPGVYVLTASTLHPFNVSTRTSVFDKIGAFAFGTGHSDFRWDSAGETFDVTANQAAPAQGFHFFEFGDQFERVIGALADDVESGSQSF